MDRETSKEEEHLFQEVMDKVREQLKDPVKEEEVDAFEERAMKDVEDFINGKKNKTEVINLPPGSVEIPDFDVLRRTILELLKDEELVRELTEHEKHHFEETERLGFKPVIILKIMRKKNGKISLQPAITFNSPDNMNSEELRNKLIAILGAPVDMSPSDEEQLGRFKK